MLSGMVWMAEDRLLAVGGDDGRIALLGEHLSERGFMEPPHNYRILAMGLLGNGLLVSLQTGEYVLVRNMMSRSKLAYIRKLLHGIKSSSLCISGLNSFG